MKINWGTGIVVSFAGFMLFILYFVFKVQSSHDYDNELVVQEYYKQERSLEATMNREQNAANLEHGLKIENNAREIKITFPEEFDFTGIKGKVSLYRPSSQNLDNEIPISLSSSYMLIPKSDLAGGRWDITVNWEYKGKSYLNKEMLNF